MLKAQLSRHNQDKLDAFLSEMRENGLSRHTLNSYRNALRPLGIYLGDKDFADAEKEDISGFLEWFRETRNGRKRKKKLTETSISLYKTKIKAFYNWLLDLPDREYPASVSWIKTTIQNKDLPVKSESDLLSDEDVKILIKSADHPRDRALVILLYETGARAQEILDLTVGSVAFDNLGATVIVNGKTGARRLRVIESVPYLRTWINNHPLIDDRDSLLWIYKRGKWQGLSYDGLHSLVKRLSAKAGLGKKVTPHLFRHSRMKYMTGKISEQKLKVYAGWKRDSRQAATYVHLSGKDLDADILRMHGLEVPEEIEHESVLEPITCPNCKYSNPATAKVCARCGAYLTLDKAVKDTMSLAERISGLEERLRLQNETIKLLFDKLTEVRAEDVVEVDEGLFMELENMNITVDEVRDENGEIDLARVEQLIEERLLSMGRKSMRSGNRIKILKSKVQIKLRDDGMK